MEISEEKFESLTSKASQYESLKDTNSQLSEENKNKGIALSEKNEKIQNLTKTLDETNSGFEAYKSEISEKLKQFDGFDDIKAKAEQWDGYNAQLKEAKVNEITTLKETLWSEFLESKADFLDWLDDDKTLAYLKDSHASLEAKNIETWTDNTGMDKKVGTEGKLNAFDTAIAGWKMTEVLWAIPMPWK